VHTHRYLSTQHTYKSTQHTYNHAHTHIYLCVVCITLRYIYIYTYTYSIPAGSTLHVCIYIAITTHKWTYAHTYIYSCVVYCLCIVYIYRCAYCIPAGSSWHVYKYQHNTQINVRPHTYVCALRVWFICAWWYIYLGAPIVFQLDLPCRISPGTYV